MDELSIPNYVSIPLCTVASLYVLRKFREFSWGWLRSKRDLTGKCFLVTGANCGLGEATVRELASRNARVILACRDVTKAEEAVKRIRSSTKRGQLVPMKVELKSLASVRQFAADFREREQQLDVLICNAGLSVPPDRKERSEDGLEIHFAVNHLAHFLLVRELTDLLKSSAPSRIVVVASSLYKSGQAMFNAETPESSVSRKNSWNSLYCDSKMANVLFVRELARKLSGSGVSAFAVCPGWCRTSLFRYSEGSLSLWKKILMLPVLFWFMRSAEQGCQTIVHCAITEGLENRSGNMFKDLKEFQYIPYVQDDALTAEFWRYSEKLIEDRVK